MCNNPIYHWVQNLVIPGDIGVGEAVVAGYIRG